MTKVNTSLIVGLTFVATLGGLLFGYDTAVISGAVSSIDAYFITPQHLSETARQQLVGLDDLVCDVRVRARGGPGGLALQFPRTQGRHDRGGTAVPRRLHRLCGAGARAGEHRPHGAGRALALHPLPHPGRGGRGRRFHALAAVHRRDLTERDRGRLVSFNQLAIVGGMLIVYFVNWYIAAQGDDAWIKATGWRLMLASEAIPALLFLVLLLFVPDTPRWFVMRGKTSAHCSGCAGSSMRRKRRRSSPRSRRSLV